MNGLSASNLEDIDTISDKRFMTREKSMKTFDIMCYRGSVSDDSKKQVSSGCNTNSSSSGIQDKDNIPIGAKLL